MSYSLADKILAYLDENDGENARVQGGNVVIPIGDGEMHRRIDGVVTKEKLSSIVADYRAATKGETNMGQNDKPQSPKPVQKPQGPKPAGGQGGQRPV